MPQAHAIVFPGRMTRFVATADQLSICILSDYRNERDQTVHMTSHEQHISAFTIGSSRQT